MLPGTVLPGAVLLAVLLLTGCAASTAGGAEDTASGPPSGEAITRLDGSTITPGALTAEIEEIVREAGVHGLSVTVVDDRRLAYARAFGHAHEPTGRPLNLDTEVYGASLSKAVFAVLVMALVEDGVLDLDTPLVELLAEKRPGQALWVDHSADHGAHPGPQHQGGWHQDLSALADDPRADRITARMALSHTTGLANWRWFEEDQQPRLHFEPGSRYSYSGEGMTLLQVALEDLTGRPLEELMVEHVFEPYGMETSSYRWQPRFEEDYAVGHRADGEPFGRDTDNDPRAPSTLETTARDMGRFLEAVLRGEGLSEASWQEIFSPQVRIRSRTQFGPYEETDAWDDIELSYGLGWGLFKTPHGWAAFKEGHSDDAFQHYMVVFPQAGDGALLLTNSEHGESAYHHLLIAALANSYTPLEWEGYVPYQPIQ